jgi:hypothetical protein
VIEVIPVSEATTEQLRDWLIDMAANLRPADLVELRATSELGPLESLVGSVVASELAWIVLHDTRPVCAFGVAPTPLVGAGNVWMLGTPGLIRIARSFLKRGWDYLRAMHDRFPLLWNYIDARNGQSAAWLEWLGFRLTEAHPNHGREGRLFFTFARYEPHV